MEGARYGGSREDQFSIHRYHIPYDFDEYKKYNITMMLTNNIMTLVGFFIRLGTATGISGGGIASVT